MARYHIIFVLVYFILPCSISAQQGTYTPSQQEEINRQRRLPPRIAELEAIGNKSKSDNRDGENDPIQEKKRKLIKESTRPSAIEKTNFPRLFDKPDSGVFTFFAWGDCVHKLDKKYEKWIRSYGTDCLDKTIPSGGMRYSFRTETYSSPPSADLGFYKDWFYGDGTVTQTILLDIGETPLAEVSLQSPFVRSLVEFVPGQTLNDAASQSVELSKGLMLGNYLFYKSVRAIPTHTYILRSIAYDGRAIHMYEVEGQKRSFDVLQGDKRKDIIVAFQYTEKDRNGGARIVWKKLRAIGSPKVEIPVTVIPAVKIEVID